MILISHSSGSSERACASTMPCTSRRRAERISSWSANGPHQVIFHGNEKPASPRIALPPRASAKLVIDASCFMSFCAEDGKPSELFDARAELDVCSATGHVRCDRDGFRLTGIRDDLR